MLTSLAPCGSSSWQSTLVEVEGGLAALLALGWQQGEEEGEAVVTLPKGAASMAQVGLGVCLGWAGGRGPATAHGARHGSPAGAVSSLLLPSLHAAACPCPAASTWGGAQSQPGPALPA